MRGQRVAPRASAMYTHADDSDSSAEPESGSASTAGNDGGDDSSNGAAASRRAGRSAGSSEGAADEDPSYDEDPGSGGAAGSPQELSLADIQTCFSLGLREAANKLGVCATTLKRHCRKHGISKWPNREIKKYHRAMAEIQRLQSDTGATLPLPSAMAAIAAVPASGRGLQNRSQAAARTQVSDGSPGRATPPRSAGPAARRPRPRRQPRATTAEAAAPASPASTRTHSDRTVGRRQPPTPEISDAPSMLGAAAGWTASDSTTPSLTAVKTGQVVEGQQQLMTPGAQHSMAHHEPQQWPPPLLTDPLEHPGGSSPRGIGAADDHLHLLGLHHQQAAVAIQQARAQGQWSGMQLAHGLAQYQPQGGLTASGGLSTWPPELQGGAQPPGVQQPAAVESHMQRWQRHTAQDPLLGQHAELGGQQPQPAHWSLSGVTGAQQQALPQQPVSLQGLQGLQQLAACGSWEAQAEQQLPSHQQDLMRAMADFTKQQRQQQLADLVAAQGPQQSGGPLLPQRGSRHRSQEQPPQGNSPMAGAQGQHWKAWAELAQGAAGLDAALNAGGVGSGAPQGPVTPAGAWMGPSAQVLQGHPMYCQAQPLAPLHPAGNNPFRPFETGQEGLGMGGIGGAGAPAAAGQSDTWYSRRSAPGEAGGFSADVPFQQPAGLGIGLPDPGFGLGGQPSTDLRHGTGSLEGLLASWQQLPQAIPSQDPVPDSPSS